MNIDEERRGDDMQKKRRARMKQTKYPFPSFSFATYIPEVVTSREYLLLVTVFLENMITRFKDATIP